MNEIRVAILLATYNGEDYLRDFLDSLIAQTYSEFSVYVRDDGSTDSTLRILQEYTEKLNMVIVPASERLGPAQNFMTLLLKTDNNDYYFFADQDDVWLPEKIEKALTKITIEEKSPVLYFSRLELVDFKLKHIGFSRYPRIVSFNNALVENVATGCTVAINHAARQLIIERMPSEISMHDWWAYIVVSAFGIVICDDYVSIKYRQHGANSIGAATSFLEDYKRRVDRFLNKRKGGVFTLSDQAAELLRCYSDLLSPQQMALTKSLIDKENILGRIKLSLSSNFVRQSMVDMLILKFIFLLGCY